MFIVSLTYKVDLSAVDQHINAHVQYLEQQYAQGHFIASGRKVPRTGGVIIAKASSQAALEAIIAQDPFFKADLADYQITEFVPTKAAADFEAFMESV